MKTTLRKGTVSRLMKLLLTDKPQAAMAIALSILSNVMALIGPLLMGKAVDAMGGFHNVDYRRVILYCVAMAASYILAALFEYTLSSVMIKVSRRISFSLREQVFNKLVHIPVSFIDKHETGDILSCVTYDINTIHDTLSTDILTIVKSFFTVVISICMMIIISPRLMLIFAVTVPLSIILTRWITKRSKAMYSEKSKKLGELNAAAEERITGMKTIQAYNQQNRSFKEFSRENAEATEVSFRAQCYSLLSGPVVNFINNCSLAAISALGAIFFISGQMTLGTISSFVLYSRKFSGPINEITNNISDLQSSFAAAERVFDFLDVPQEDELWTHDKHLLSASEKGVEIRDAHFGYDSGEEVIHGINASAKHNTVTAVVGPTGSGKTTLINLIMGFYPLDSGSICINGIDIRKLPLCEIRSSCDMILQDSWIFSGSIYDNIAYGRENVAAGDVVNASKKAQIYDYISNLPHGFNTVIGEGGLMLSKGQKQMIAIARAMLSKSEILIFDEATSNVDVRTERQIQAALNHLAAGKTCIIIAHRLSTVKRVDNIIVLNRGRVVQQGTHNQLMERDGLYRQMYCAQS